MLFLQVSERTNLCSVAKVNQKDVGPVSLLNTVSIGRSATRASRLLVCHFNKYFKKDCEIMDVKSAKHSEWFTTSSSTVSKLWRLSVFLFHADMRSGKVEVTKAPSRLCKANLYKRWLELCRKMELLYARPTADGKLYSEVKVSDLRLVNDI